MTTKVTKRAKLLTKSDSAPTKVVTPTKNETKKKEGYISRSSLLGALKLCKVSTAAGPIRYPYFIFKKDCIMSFSRESYILIPFDSGLDTVIGQDKFYSVVNDMSCEDIILKQVGNSLQLFAADNSTKSSFSVISDTEELKSVAAEVEKVKVSDITWHDCSKELLDGLLLCLFSYSQAVDGKGLCGVWVQPSCCYSSDNYRISKYTFPTALDGVNGVVVVPGKYLQGIFKITKPTAYSIYNNWFCMKFDKGVIALLLLAAETPSGKAFEIDRFFSGKEPEVFIKLPNMEEQIRRVGIMPDEKSFDSKISVFLKKDEIVLRGEKPEVGWVEERIGFEGKALKQDNLQVLLNPYFMIEAMKHTAEVGFLIEQFQLVFKSTNFRQLMVIHRNEGK